MRAREYKYRFLGGKIDDITVIVAYIKETKNEIDNSLTRDNSTTDLAENESYKSPLFSGRNINESLKNLNIKGI